MKAIVEFGRNAKPFPASGSIVLPSRGAAARAAAQIAFVMEGRTLVTAQDLTPCAAQPRVTWWSPCGQQWIAVSLLDGVDRGDYAAIAWRKFRVKEMKAG